MQPTGRPLPHSVGTTIKNSIVKAFTLPLKIIRSIALNILAGLLIDLDALVGFQSPFKFMHARFHRISIDEPFNKDVLDELDGFSQSEVLDEFFLHSLEPAVCILQEGPPNAHAVVNQIERTLMRSKFSASFLFSLLPSGIQAKILSKKVLALQDGESMLFFNGVFQHAIVTEIKKTGNNAVFKIYNSGFGGVQSPFCKYKFLVPQYQIPQKNIKIVLCEMAALDSVFKKSTGDPRGEKLSKVFHTIFSSQGGIQLPSSETHTFQDRGNCAWKSLSTWVRKQSNLCHFKITDAMIKVAEAKAPYAKDVLVKLHKGNKEISLNYFMKIIGYEYAREQIQKKFSHFKNAKLWLYARLIHFSLPTFLKSEKTSSADVEKYISTLVSRVTKEDVLTRYKYKKNRF